MIVSKELESEITVVKSLLMHLLIGADKLREIERLAYIGDMLVYVLDDDDFEGNDETCIAFLLTKELSNSLMIEDDCDTFINRLREILIERDKFEFLHFLEL